MTKPTITVVAVRGGNIEKIYISDEAAAAVIVIDYDNKAAGDDGYIALHGADFDADDSFLSGLPDEIRNELRSQQQQQNPRQQ